MRVTDSIIPTDTKISVGFSGGRDSTALLHYLKTNGYDVQAVYINHSVPKDHKWAYLADHPHWVDFCRAMCRDYDIPFIDYVVDVSQFGKNWESSARAARHKCFKEINTPIILAHHNDDQIELLLMKVFRGSSVDSLVCMRQNVVINGTTFIRPLLETSRQDIIKYMQLHGLKHIEDSSNSDCSFDRNFIRALVLPHLKSRFCRKAFMRCLSHIADANDLLEQLAEHDISVVTQHVKLNTSHIKTSWVWSLDRLRNLPDNRIKNMLKTHLRKQGKPYTYGILAEFCKYVRQGKEPNKPYTLLTFRQQEFKFDGTLVILS